MRTFATRKEAVRFVRDLGLGKAPDRVTYSRQRDGRFKPIVHVEHYADAEYIRETHGIEAKADA